MGLILRTSSLANPGNSLTVKGSALTFAEGDGNFMYLLTNMSGSTISITGSTGILGNLTATGDITFTLPNIDTTNIVSYDPSTGRLYYQTTSSLSVGTSSYIDSSNVYGPDGADSITNALFASSSISASYATNADASQTAVSSTTSVTASLALQALTASFITLQAGPGITTNGTAITASVRSVNGNFPDANGNILTSLTSTIIGTSASLVASSSGAITSSLSDGLVWIIAGDPTPANNGDTYIFSSGSVSGSWYPISTLDTAAGDARYLKLTPQSPLSGSLNMGGFNITNAGTLQGTASWASQALTASNLLNNTSISTGSVSATVSTDVNNLFRVTSGSVNFLQHSGSMFIRGGIVGASASLVLINSNPQPFFGVTSVNSFAAVLNAWSGSAAPLAPHMAMGNGSVLVMPGKTLSNFNNELASAYNSGSSFRVSSALGDSIFDVYRNGNVTIGDLFVDDGYKLTVTGSGASGSLNLNGNLIVSGSSIRLPNLTTSSVSNVVMIDTTTGQLFYTSSAAVVSGSGTIINNNTNNYLLTATGTNQINGENNLQFNGTSLIVTGSITSSADIQVKGLTIGQGNKSIAGETYNTAFGKGVLDSNVSGSYNTAVGWSALSASQLNNSYNTVIGAFALPTAFTGSNNTALGAYSLGSLITGSANTAIGYTSLLLLTSGVNNTALGASSLDSLITGSFNTANGTSALHNLINGDGNTSLGSIAGNGLFSGSDNTFVGRAASSNLFTGSNNVSIGREALRGRGSGTNTQNTVAIGYQANYTGSSNGVYIGYQAGYNETSNNKLYISNDSSSTPLIKGDFATRSLDISGNSTITGSLTVITGSSIELQVTNTGVKIGSIITDTHTITGSTSISGSVSISGSLSATSFTGSFSGTVSTASYILSSNVNGPNGADSITTSSYSLYAVTSSYIQGGALNYVPLWSGSNILTSSLLYQTGSSIGIGTTTPGATLNVSGSGNFTNGVTVAGILAVTGSTVLTLTTGSPLQNIVLVDTASGQLYYTSSAAVSTATLTGGAANRIPLWSSTSAITTSSFFQSGSSILLGATSSATRNAFHIIGSGSGTGFRYTGRDNLNYVLLEDGATTGSGTSLIASFYKANDNTVASLDLTPGSSSLVSTDILTLNSNIVNAQGDVFAYMGDYEGNANNVYIEVDQADTAVYIPTGNVGIGKAASLNAKLDILGDVIVTGSLIAASSSLSNFLRIIPSSTLPTASQGAIAVSGSGVQCRPYFFNGTSWNPFYTVPVVTSSFYADVLTVDGVLYASQSQVQVTGSLNIKSGSGDFYIYGHKQYNYGVFQTNQSFSGSANVSSSMPITVTDEAVGVSIVSSSRITFENAGVYNLQFSAQIVQTGAATVYIWFKKNGTNVAGSATELSVANGESTVPAWNYMLSANANDYVEIAWQGNTAGGTVFTYRAATGNIPIVPSLIVTVHQVR